MRWNGKTKGKRQAIPFAFCLFRWSGKCILCMNYYFYKSLFTFTPINIYDNMTLTPYQAQYLAYELTRYRSGKASDKLTSALLDAQVELTPHQVEAALFAFRSPLSQGAQF